MRERESKKDNPAVDKVMKKEDDVEDIGETEAQRGKRERSIQEENEGRQIEQGRIPEKGRWRG